MNVYDLVVAGGGPAGCAAGITAVRAGGRVLLLEAGTYPRHKVCGEFVSSESLETLASLLKGHDLLWAALRIDRTRLFLRGALISARLPSPAASITRYDLDAALWASALQAGCDARQQIRVGNIDPLESGTFLCRTSAGDFEAKTVIIAAGRWSNLRKHAPAADGRGWKWIGVKAHFREPSHEEPASRASVDLYFFEGGYCGVQPISADAVNACAMVRSDVATDMEHVIGIHPDLRVRARTWTRIIDPVTTAPLVFSEPQPERDGILYAGDAAAFVDPFVGDGISLALHSGMAAAHALAPVWQERIDLENAAFQYRAEYASRFGPVLRHAARMRRLLSLPRSMQAIAGALLRIPALSGRVIRMTRVRAG